MKSTLKLLKTSVFFAIFIFTTAGLSAKTTLTPYGTGTNATQDAAIAAFNSDQEALADSANKIDQSVLAYIYGTPNAVATSLRGIGTSYGPGPKVAIFGVNLGLGIAGDAGTFGDVLAGDLSSINGFGTNLSIMAGLNLGLFSVPFLNKMRVYLHFMTMDLDFVGGNFAFTNFGINLQYSIIDDVPIVPVLITWGGLRVTSGFELTTMTASLTGINMGSYNVGAGLTWAPTGTLKSTSEISTIPIEVSTSFNLIFLTMFGGAGLDFNFGSSTLKATADGQFKELSTAGIRMSSTTSLSPDTADFRLFWGVQLNLAILKIVGQMNYALTSGAYSALMGVRVAF